MIRSCQRGTTFSLIPVYWQGTHFSMICINYEKNFGKPHIIFSQNR